MALPDLHVWSIVALVAALLAVNLSLQSLPAERGTPRDGGVCEKPGFEAMALVLALH
jgi:hypothetical protein